MIWQLHWQFKDGRTKFPWIEYTQARFPLPPDAQWLLLNQDDPRFAGVDEDTDDGPCPYPIKGDDGTATDCIDKGHCACEERKK
jgi:hypothetical protein